MFARGMSFAIPEMMPEAVAEENYLYVSAENSLFGNVFAGAQIVEIIVRDPARDETDEKQSEPTVEVNGETVRMVQGEDGYWYAYIASTAAAAASTSAAGATTNIDLGVAETAAVGPDIGENRAAGIAAATKLAVSSTVQVYSDDSGTRTENNGRESAPTMSKIGSDPTATYGQLNVTTTDWPFVQTWEFKDDSDVEIIFEKPGADEVVTLTFETAGTGMEDYAYIELDRSSGPAGAELHMTIYDNQLNHDPTQDDSVWFLTNGTWGVSYNASATYTAYPQTEFGDNGKLKISKDLTGGITANVLFTQDNADCIGTSTGDYTSPKVNERSGGGFSGYHCFTETGANTGIFTNGDDADKATVIVSTTAVRGTTASIDYNDAAQSYLVTTTAGTIDMAEAEAGDEWNSGEAITVTLVDPDRNLNTGSDEDLTLSVTDRIPTIKIGSPLNFVQGSTGGNITINKVDGISGIATWTADVATGANDHDDGAIWTLDTGLTAVAINNMNSSLAQRYVALDVSSICSDSTIAVAGQTAQTNKGVISYGTDKVDSAAGGEADVNCRVDHDVVPQVAATTENRGYVTFMAFGTDDNHGQYRIEV